MELKSSVRYRNTPKHTSKVNHYQGMIDNRVPLRSAAEQARDKWMSNSYPFNHIVLMPLSISKYLMVNDALEEQIIQQTAHFAERLRPEAFMEGMTLEFLQQEGGTLLTMKCLLAMPEEDNRWSMKQTFNFTLPQIDDQARDDIASLVIDMFLSRRFLNHQPYEWFRGTSLNVHTHSRKDANELHSTIAKLLKEDCQISLQRFPLILKPLRDDGVFAREHGKVETWSINTISKNHQERVERHA